MGDTEAIPETHRFAASRLPGIEMNCQLSVSALFSIACSSPAEASWLDAGVLWPALSRSD